MPQASTVLESSEPPGDEGLWALPDEQRTERLRELGEAVYAVGGPGRCELCHGADGQGLPGAIAPLADNRSWADDCLALMAVVLFGSNEIFERDGFTYAGVMPPLADRLDDVEVAAVSTFVNGRFGTGSACDPADVAVLRHQGPRSWLE